MRLKQWFEALDFSISFSHKKQQKSHSIETISVSQCAFELATSEDISETLPKVLNTFQETINQGLSKHYHAQMMVLMTRPQTSESFIYHSGTKSPSASFVQKLHRDFMTRPPTSSEQVEFNENGKNTFISVKSLLNAKEMNVWLLSKSEYKLPDSKRLAWRTASLESALIEGIEAWHRKDMQIQKALANERREFAAELHDTLAQMLGYLRLKSASLDKRCNHAAYAELKPIAEDLAAYTHCAYRQTRELIATARLPFVGGSLSDIVMNSINEFEHQSSIVFELDNRLHSNSLNQKQLTQIQHIVRESLSNIVRHSHATHSKVTLMMKGQQLRVQIEDNGDGIDLNSARKDSFGIQIMKERASRIGAELNIGNNEKSGSKTVLILDLGETNE